MNDVSGLFAAFLIVASLYFAREVLVPLCLAGLITFLLAPIATWLERLRLPKSVAGILVISLTTLGVCSIGWVVLGQVYNLAVELPQYQNNITQKAAELHLQSAGKLTTTVQMLNEVSQQVADSNTNKSTLSPDLKPHRTKGIESLATLPSRTPTSASLHPVPVQVEDANSSWISAAISKIQPLASPAASVFAVIIFVIFMLLARYDIRDRTVRLMGSDRIHVTTVAMTEAATRVSRYLLMQFSVNLGYGLVVGAALWALGIPHPLLWAVTTFLFRFVPYVGIMAACAGPLLMALAVSPHWSTAGWTLGLYIVLELVAANAIEPCLYGSSTGVSALAILVAAVFWTWLWGIPGLLLSTPLTVCLIVLGQHVPRLQFLGVLFSEQPVLDPPQRLYQRVLASDSRDAGKLIEEALKTQSLESVYDNLVIPTLSLVEEARHADQLDSHQGELALQEIEELVEEQWTWREVQPDLYLPSVVCIAVKDVADDIASRLLKNALAGTHTVEILTSEMLSADVVDTIDKVRPEVICVVGVPPQAIRHLRVRCHQLRTRFPEHIIVACVFSTECDLANVRGRIPISDANHVVCSLDQAQQYLKSLTPRPSMEIDGTLLQVVSPAEPLKTVVLDESSDDIFNQITRTLARSFNAPVALINIFEEGEFPWRSQCGLPTIESGDVDSLCIADICRQAALPDGLIVPDTMLDCRFQDDPVLLERGLRFFAGMPVSGFDEKTIGALCVFDTRPREITPQQEKHLRDLAQAVTNAIALQRVSSAN